jgi:hypothetical protein
MVTISLDEDAFAAAQTYINELNTECGLSLIARPYAVVVLDNRFLRDDGGDPLGEDITVKLFVYAVELTGPSSFIETLVLVRFFSGNQNLINYLKGKELIPGDSSTSEITGKYKEKSDESGTEVKGNIQVLDSNDTIEFNTRFIKSVPEFEYGPTNLKVRFDFDDECRCFTTSHDRAVHKYEPPPAGVLVDIEISLDPSSLGATIFNGQNDVAIFRFAHQYVISEEIPTTP